MTSVEEDRQAAVPHSSRRSWIRYLVLLTVLTFLLIAGAVVLFGWDWLPHPAPFRTTAGPAGCRVFHEPRNDWTVEYPASWHAQRIKEVHEGSPYTAEAYGILITNIDRRFEHPKLPKGFSSFDFDMKGVPDTFAGVRIMWSYPGGFVMRCTDENRKPLSLKMAKRMPARDEWNPHLEVASLRFSARQEPLYTVSAWTGSDVSNGDRARLERIVASISFPDGPPAPIPPPPNCLG